jgi:Skp family chaperone for outer membrane proteins
MTLLTLDLRSLLDSCKVGIEAAKGLEKAWNEAKPADDAAKTKLLRELESKRDTLRTALLARAKPVIAELAKKKGAAAVLEKGTVLWSESEDITAQVAAKVDAGGPLKL